MNEIVQRALKCFGLPARSIKKPSDAKLASVYIVDDRYVLRSRPCLDNTRTSFDAERELLGLVGDLTGCQFPQYQVSERGEYFFIDGRTFWTLHRLIPGRPLGSWYELHRLPSHVDQQVMTALRRLHDSTKGRFAEHRISRTFLADLVEPVLIEVSAFLNEESLRRIHSAFLRIKEFSRSFPAKEACFVHGDFHHGNILAHEGIIVGYIDLDWCRIGNALEDLGFTMMMLLRDYENWSTQFRWQRYRELLDRYGFDDDPLILNDCIALYALFDCHVFRAATFKNSIDFHAYQMSFLETLCKTFTTGER